MPDCYLCGTSLAGSQKSKEHIIAAALGGHHWSYDLLCRDCNSALGNTIDAELCAQMVPFANLLGIKRPRGTTPKVLVTLEDGKQYLRDADGNMHLLPQKPVIREDGRTLHFETQSSTKKHIRQALRGLKRRYPNIDLSDAEKQITESRKVVSQVTTFEAKGLGGEEVRRSITKIAANFAVWRKHLEKPSCAPFISGHEQESNQAGWWTGSDPIANRPKDTVLHIVALLGRSGVVQAYVELFHAFRFAVTVHNDYWGDEFVDVMAIDVLTGNDVPVQWGQSSWSMSNFPPVETIRQDMAELVRVAQSANRRRWINVAVDRAFKSAISKYGSQATVEHLLPELWKEMEPFLVAEVTATTRSRLKASNQHPVDE